MALATVTGIAFLAPNTQEIMGRFYWEPRGSLESGPSGIDGLWLPCLRWASVICVAATWSLLGLAQVSEFLYQDFWHGFPSLLK